MKRTIILLVITLAVAAWVYWMEVREDTRLRDTEEREQVSKTLSGVTSREIKGFTLEKAGGEAIRAERFGEEWLLREPVSARAEESTVREVLWDIEWTEKERTIEPDELNDDLLKEYGLTEPRGHIEILTRIGRERYAIGGENPGGELVYVRSDQSGAVFLVKKAFAENLDKTVFEMRNKSVVTVVPTQAALIKLFGPTKAVLSREAGHWNLTDPFEDHGNPETINNLLDRASKLKAQSFVSEAPESYEEYGLVSPDSPDVLERGKHIVIGEGRADGKMITVYFGNEAPPGADGQEQVYAMVKGEPTVFTVPADDASALFVTVDALQSRKVTRMDPYALKKVTISHGLTQVEFEKRDFDWQIVKPFEAAADNNSVKELLDVFKDARIEEQVTAEGVPERYGLDVPRGSFSFVQAESEPASVIFGGEADELTVFAKRRDTPGVFKVSKSLFDRLATPALEFHTRGMQTISMDKAEEIKIVRGSRTYRLKPAAPIGVSRDWNLVEPAEAPSNPMVVPRIILGLATTTASALVERAPSDLAQYGLDEPSVRVSVKVGEEEPQPKALLLGNVAEGGDWYAMLEGGDLVFKMARDVAKVFRQELRRPQVFSFGRAEATRVEFRRDEETWSIVKADGTWTVESPEGSKVDSAMVEDELYHLSALETPEFVRYETTQLEQYGLLKPRAVIRIETPSGVAALSVGDTEQSGHHYATSSTVDGVFLINPGDILNILEPTRLITEGEPTAGEQTGEEQ
ncbi:MAG: DUF4340 domain-containing protein [Planctomycetota bacterium]|jgi:hypothetical protein